MNFVQRSKETLKTETNHASKRRGYGFWIGCFALSLGLPLLLYYGYCWGLWGRSSLLLQYVFQCNCPAASEEARYPDTVDVIVPACRYVSTRLLPSGRLLYVHEKRLWLTSTYLLDLQTDEKITIALPKGLFYFLTDNLLYVSSGEEYILDWINGKQYPIRKFANWRPNAYINGEVNLSVLAEALGEAKVVFFINDDGTIVALAPDFHIQPERNFFIRRLAFPGYELNRVEQFLHENNIVYQSIPASFPGEAVSLDGRFIARHDGIYLIETNQLIVRAYPSRLRGWTSDGRGVIYSSSGPCLIRTNFGILDDTACFFQVPQPVLKLKVPEEYLLPSESP